jgi:c(7)-type cytochrome triheme protein
MIKAVEPMQTDPTTSRRTCRRWIQLVVLIAECVCVALAFASNYQVAATSAREPAAQETKDFSKFSHNNASHQRLPCLLCHRRETNSPKPVRSSGHTPCAGCHSQQFAASSGPICTICHSNIESGNHQVKPFPSLKSFNMTFEHSRHRSVACATCHKAINRGVAMSIPSGPDAHQTCYQCHTPRAQAGGRDISSCATCHKAGSFNRLSTSSKAFKASFGHELHKRQGASCAECHKITSLTARSSQVSSPLATEHPSSQNVQSCETCHNDQRAFGIASFSNCKRCHQGPTFKF